MQISLLKVIIPLGNSLHSHCKQPTRYNEYQTHFSLFKVTCTISKLSHGTEVHTTRTCWFYQGWGVRALAQSITKAFNTFAGPLPRADSVSRLIPPAEAGL